VVQPGKESGAVIVPIEIKVNIDGDVDQALSALRQSHGQPEWRQIWFAEDRFAISEGKLALLDGGAIVRFRSGEGPDELTLKLRPCDEQQLVGKWSDSFEEESFKYRIEGDWSGSRHVLAASAVSNQPQDSLLDTVAMGVDAAIPLDDNQRQFFDDCARPGVHADRLVALGPIAATKWSELKFGELDVNMERWTVADLDFLELSIRVKPKGGETVDTFESRAAAKQQELHQAVIDRGTAISERRENKTQRVLAALAERYR
jgi:hypothetical protein